MRGDLKSDGLGFTPEPTLSLDEFKGMFQELIDLDYIDPEFGISNNVAVIDLLDITELTFEKLSELFSTIDFCAKRLNGYNETKRLFSNSMKIRFYK